MRARKLIKRAARKREIGRRGRELLRGEDERDRRGGRGEKRKEKCE